MIPTHDHPFTLDLAVGSVLEQTVTDLDVVVIGDGVSDDTRAVVSRLREADPRVRFLDRPKSESRAEETRHEVLGTATSPFVCYLGDDDLMLPNHVGTMTQLLAEADFAHPLPMVVTPDSSLWPHPTDLSRPACVEWHLRPGCNALSLTGAAHRLDAYRRLPSGWRSAPAGRWSDHFMWEQWFRVPGLRFVTGRRLTVLKFDASLRRHMSPEERRAELLRWLARSQDAGFAQDLSELILDGQRRWAIQARLDAASLQDRALDSAAGRDAAMVRLREETTKLDVARAELSAMRATFTWRLHDRLARLPGMRRLIGWVRRLRGHHEHGERLSHDHDCI